MLIQPSDPEFLSSRLREEGQWLAGGREASAQRAAVYHHLYAHSLGNHAFPLLAAHVSIWVSRCLRRAERADEFSKWKSISSRRRAKRMQPRERFAGAIREIDRRVFVEVFHLYRLTERPETRALAAARVPAPLLEEMDNCHAARRARRTMSTAERRALFASVFLWAHEEIIAPALEAALAETDWHAEASRPLRLPVRLAYMSRRRGLLFTSAGGAEQPLELALRSFDLAELVGWRKVESSLKSSGLMPDPFRQNSGQHFFSIQNRARRLWQQEFLAAC